MSETQPNNLSDTQPRKINKAGRGFFWISLLVLLAAIIAGSLSGYGIGIGERVNAEKAQSKQQLDEQFALARQDLDAGRYELASKRLQYILQKDAAYPGVGEMLVEVQVKLSITPTAEPTATPTITPTPDMRSQEAIYAQAQQQLQSKDWSGAMASLDALRKADPSYHVVDVDGMYYIALRNRGVEQIQGTGAYTSTNMEGGIYDLTLAERFGPLDNTALALQNGARMFLLASSFYGIDWGQAVSYFGEVNAAYPQLRDAAGVTAAQRYAESLLAYGDLQAANGKKLDDRCQALDSWGAAGSIIQLNDEYQYKYNQLNLECNPPTPTIDPATLITPEVPTAEATVAPTP